MNTNLEKLKIQLKEIGADAILLSMKKYYGNEHEEFSDIYRISGFSGSNARAIVTLDEAILAVDGRYTKQAKEQTDNDVWQVENYPEVNSAEMVRRCLRKGESLAICTKNISYKSYVMLEDLVSQIGATLKPIDNMVVFDEHKHEAMEPCKLRIMDSCDIGESVNDRIIRVQETITEGEVVVIADKATIGWMFGIRRSSLAPDKGVLANCIAFVPKGGRPLVYCDMEMEGGLADFDLCTLEELESIAMSSNDGVFKIDYHNIPAHYVLSLKKNGKNIQPLDRKNIALESIKNQVEVQNQKKGAELTSLAFIRTLCWADNNEKKTEKDVANYFQDAILKYSGAIGLSFNTICAFGSNTSLVHYTPGESPKEIAEGGLLLFDAGVHFGNTDMTRTIYVGNCCCDEYRKIYTTVLKSVIMFSTAKFPNNTKASTIDAFARYHLWKDGLDYKFGTGHGVGCFAGVHEYPGISQGSKATITANMTMTVEPGVYTDEYGIRLENMLLTVAGPDSEFIYFETLNYIPFCQKLIDKEMLIKDEISWINEYHKKTCNMFKDELKNDPETLRWLVENTKEI